MATFISNSNQMAASSNRRRRRERGKHIQKENEFIALKSKHKIKITKASLV